MPDIEEELVRAAFVIAAAGLSDAFGHVSVRQGDELIMTSPVPLEFQTVGELVHVPLRDFQLPADAPKEAWIHVAIANRYPHAGAICRAQPRNVARAIAGDRTLIALDGQGALLGEQIPIYKDSRLVRTLSDARIVAETISESSAIVLSGNGAVTTGTDLASATARMWLLDRRADLALAAAPHATPLPVAEQEWWRERDRELLPRIYSYLLRKYE